MYRIAIIDSDPDAREETHRLAAMFFAGRQVSAAFVICEDCNNLPKYYDCYLLGNSESVSLLLRPEETPWKTIPKPLDQERFFELLTAWRTSAGDGTAHTPGMKDTH